MKPRILLAAKSNPQNYMDAVVSCGGEAIWEYPPKMDTDCDGLILCGGGDIHPKYFHEEIDGSNDIDPERDALEFALTRAFAEAGKPILGICRGHQVINVYFGGSLHQDLSNARAHTSFAGHDLVHPVRAAKGSIAQQLYGDCFSVNSHHHQGLNRLGQGLIPSIWSLDGTVVEGIEHTTLPILGIQWHPERMCFSKARSDTADGSRIFQYFLNLCK